MKVISLWQPWASFIAIGIKPFETRDWPPPRWLVGQRIAIHAAKKHVNTDDREWAAKCGVVGDLPLGAIVCTALLAGAYQCGDKILAPRLINIWQRRESLPVAALDPAGIPTDEFGNYCEGRWAWSLTDIERFEPAIQAKGAQGLWDWTAP